MPWFITVYSISMNYTLIQVAGVLCVLGAIFYSKILTFNGSITIRLVVPKTVNIVIEPSQQYLPPNTTTKTKTQPQTHPSISLPQVPQSKRYILESIASFTNYGDYQTRVLDRKRSRFNKVSASQRAFVDFLGYESHFYKADEQIRVNSALALRIAQHGREVYEAKIGEEHGLDQDFGIVAESFGHMVRDWTDIGRTERAKIFPPILQSLSTHFQDIPGRKNILIPGFGLGRLAHEIAENEGYVVTANDIDYTAILAYNYLLNRTSTLHQHTFYPFTTSWVQQLHTSSRFQAVRAPDYIPSPQSKANVKVVEGDFLAAFAEPGYTEKFDAVVTLFFIDVGENIIDFLARIKSVLKPNGIWINLGPLKWGGHAQLQLSAEEVLDLADKMGFDVDQSSRQSIDALYAHQPDSLLKYTYVAQFWCATKRPWY